MAFQIQLMQHSSARKTSYDAAAPRAQGQIICYPAQYHSSRHCAHWWKVIP